MGTLAEYGLTVTQSMTTPSKAGKQPRPVWEVSGNTTGLEDLLYDLGGKRWRGAFSFWSDPTEALLERLPTTERTSFAERLEAKRERAEERAERYTEYAENAATRGDARLERARGMADGIPFGQPILVGHHSEKRDRAYRGRIHNNFAKGFEEHQKARHYEEKAAAASRGTEEKSLPFMHRRLKEAETNLRKVTRSLAECERPDYAERCQGLDPEQLRLWIVNAKARQADDQEQVEYWQAQIAAKSAQVVEAGGAVFSPADVAKGDVVVIARRGPYLVERVNALTVSVSEMVGNYRWKQTRPYAEITEIIKPSDERYATITAKLAEVNAPKAPASSGTLIERAQGAVKESR